MASADNHPNEYMHGADADEQARLEMLATLLGGAGFLPPLRAGMHIVEVGCGTGAITREVARHVAPGIVVGIDREEAQLATARRLADAAGLGHVEFRRGDASDLDLADDTFDLAYCRFVLEHVPDRQRAVDEMARVVKPGGVVCALEWENSCGAIHPAAPAVKEVWDAIYRWQTDRGGDGFVARKLYGLFRRAGLGDVRAEGRAWTIVAAEPEKLRAYVDGGREIIKQTRDGLLREKRVTPDLLARADEEYERLLHSPDGYVFEGFCRAVGVVPSVATTESPG